MHTLSTRLRRVALSLVLLGSSSSPVWATPYMYRIYMLGIHGTSTQLTATPGSLAFGTVSEGQAAVRSFTLANTGNAPTSPLTFSLPATVTQTNTCGASLAAGANCLVTATYAPTTTVSLTGSIVVSDQDSTAQVSVAGTGYAPTYAQWASGSGPNINIVGPQTIEFGNNESYPDWESGVATVGKSSGKWYFEIPLSYPAGIATGIMSNGTWAGTNAYIYSAPNGYYAEKGTVYTYTSAEQT
jgi:hypothetical protein